MASEKEARPRYQRRPRNVHNRTYESYHNHDMLGAFLALALCIAIVWGSAWVYQIGYSDCERHHQEVSSHV